LSIPVTKYESNLILRIIFVKLKENARPAKLYKSGCRVMKVTLGSRVIVRAW
jgi:hypothetical protein